MDDNDEQQIVPVERVQTPPLTVFANIRDYLRDAPMQLCVVRGIPRIFIDTSVIDCLRDALLTMGDIELREKLDRRNVAGFSRLYRSDGVVLHYFDERTGFVKLPQERVRAEFVCIDHPRDATTNLQPKEIRQRLRCRHTTPECVCKDSREFARYPYLELKNVFGTEAQLTLIRNRVESYFIKLCCEYDPDEGSYTQRVLAPWDPLYVPDVDVHKNISMMILDRASPRIRPNHDLPDQS
jgi:hypothetical protein